MRLKKGSWYYIIGILFLMLSSLSAFSAFIFCLLQRNSATKDNPLLSPFGGEVASGVILWILAVAMVTAAFITWICILLASLKYYSLSKPFKTVGVVLMILSVVLVAVFISQMDKSTSATHFFQRILKTVPMFALGLWLLLLAFGKRKTQIPCIFFCAMSAYSSFTCFGFENLFRYQDTVTTNGNILAYISLMLFCLSMCQYFLGLCLCVCSCEKRPENLSKIVKDEEIRLSEKQL